MASKVCVVDISIRGGKTGDAKGFNNAAAAARDDGGYSGFLGDGLGDDGNGDASSLLLPVPLEGTTGWALNRASNDANPFR